MAIRKAIKLKWSSLKPPQRVNMAILSFFGLVLAYAMRNALALAITVIVPPTHSADPGNSAICPIDPLGNGSSTSSHGFGQRYDWTQREQGLILSAFYFGYWITHIPGGILAEKYGGKWILSLGLLSTAIFTIITPVAIHWGNDCSHMVLFILRFLMGIGEGTTFPAISTLIAAWVPKKERGKIATFVYSAIQIGSVVTYYFTGLLLARYVWDVVFYVWGILSVLWFIIFTLVCYNDPESHPFISQKERDYLLTEMGQLKRQTDLPTPPWKDIFTSAPVIVLIIAQVGHDWGLFIMVNDLPKYMREVLGFSVHDVGIYASLPYLAMWIVSMSCGFLSDFLIIRGCMSITRTRKIFSFIGQVFPGIFMVLASLAECNRPLVVTWFVFAMALMGSYYVGVRLNPLDLSPNYAGTLMALKNGFGSLCGGMAPTAAGWILRTGSLGEWRTVFIVTLIMLIATILPFMFLASGEIQKWNDPKPNKPKKQMEDIPIEQETEEDKIGKKL